jgi:hypothetical protein
MLTTEHRFTPVQRFLRIGLVGLLLAAVASSAPGSAQGPTLAGTWRVTQALGTQQFLLVMDFSDGGASHYTDQTNSAGVGVWRKNTGGNFSATFEEFAGNQRLQFRATIQLVNANSFMGTVTGTRFDITGTQVLGTFPQTTLDGTRMFVIPE